MPRCGEGRVLTAHLCGSPTSSGDNVPWQGLNTAFKRFLRTVPRTCQASCRIVATRALVFLFQQWEDCNLCMELNLGTSPILVGETSLFSAGF